MWLKLGLAILFAIIDYLLTPKPKQQQVNPATNIGGVPQASPGKEIPMIYGTVWQNEPQVAWWGDMATQAIKQKGSKK